MRRALLVLAAALLFATGCGAPEVVQRAEIQEAMIFDSVTGSIRTWVGSLAEPTPEHAAVKEQVLALIERRRGEYRSLHEQVRKYLETDAVARALVETEPVFLDYLEWLVEEITDE